MYYHFNVEYGDKSANRIAELNHNAGLIMRYPFLLPRNRWTDMVDDDYDFTFTEIDALADGWMIAFGNEMLEELSEILKEADYEDSYRILDIKEKFGGLRWYTNGIPKTISDKYDAWERKYVELSFETCLACGKPATMETFGWINFICDDCFKKWRVKGAPIEKTDNQHSLL